MADRGDERVGADHDVLADVYRSNVEDGDVVVGEESIAHVDVQPVVTVEVRLHGDELTGGAQQLPNEPVLSGVVGGIGRIELAAQDQRPFLACGHLLIKKHVRLAGVQLLQLGPRCRRRRGLVSRCGGASAAEVVGIRGHDAIGPFSYARGL